jgi:acyl-CoA synthetase (AMP-forming)/AMP-acid ligase II
VVAERSRSAGPGEWQPEAIAPAIRRAVWRYNELALHEVVLTEPGRIPRTSSGKIARSACRQNYLDGSFTAGPDAARGERR